jgi:hypothetical protein
LVSITQAFGERLEFLGLFRYELCDFFVRGLIEGHHHGVGIALTRIMLVNGITRIGQRSLVELSYLRIGNFGVN